MVLSKVYGINRFAEYMSGYEDCYTIIGGTACDIIMREAGYEFRATNDIDMILLIENRFPEMGRALWRLIKDGGYRCGWKSSKDVHFYRFTEPTATGFPSMIELFSKAPDFMSDFDDPTIVPLPIGEDFSSLSAILLNDDYYNFMKSGRKSIEGVTVMDETHLIPFKAKAYIELSARKADGEHVNSDDLKKHKKDVFRLIQIIDLEERVELPSTIVEDMREFMNLVATEGVPLKQMGIEMPIEEALRIMRVIYSLE